MSPRFLLVSCLALVIAAVATAQTADDYASCLCWDESTNASCDGSEESCNRLITDPSVLPYVFGVGSIIVAALFFFFFPCFFAAGRLCNCCGGRDPSYGCCCPYKRFGVARVYSPATINSARFMAVIVFLAAIGSGVMFQFAVRRAADTIENIGNLAGDIENDVTQLQAQAQLASDVLSVYGIAAVDFDFDGAQILTPLRNVESAMNTTTSDVRKSQYVAYILAVFGAIGLVLALCGARGFFVTCFAMLMSFFAFIALTVLFAFAAGAAVTQFACSPSHAQATQAYINSSLRVNYASRHVAAAVSDAENAALSYVCNVSGFNTLCESGDVYCAVNPCTSSTGSVEERLFSLNDTVNADSSLSIAACAVDTTCSQHNVALNFMQDFNAIFPALSNVSVALNTNVADAINGMHGVEIFDLMCNNYNGVLSSLRMLTYAGLATSGMLILAIIVYVRGAKRFHRGPGLDSPSMVYMGYSTIPPEAVSLQQPAYWGAPTTVEATPILAGQYQQQYGAPSGKTGSDYA